MPLGKLPSALPPYDARRDLLSFPTRRSSDLGKPTWALLLVAKEGPKQKPELVVAHQLGNAWDIRSLDTADGAVAVWSENRKSTRLNSSHLGISYAVFCLKKKTGREAELGPVE